MTNQQTESVEIQRVRMSYYKAIGSPEVCPRCSEGLPDCVRGLSHSETCAQINWRTRCCLRCELEMLIEESVRVVPVSEGSTK